MICPGGGSEVSLFDEVAQREREVSELTQDKIKEDNVR